ncbi:MAG: class I SAM-dependent methyltransferase [Polyangia bacterium]
MKSITEPLRQLLKAHLGPAEIARLRKAYWKVQRLSTTVRHPRSLRGIGETFNAGKHLWYYPLYERHFGPLRARRLNLLEIGIGGYDTPVAGGGSLRMWETYLPRARVAGVDIYNKSPHDSGRVRTFQGSQADPDFLRHVVATIGRPDVIIDDGSHISEHVIASFQVLFPLLADDGIYVIEDTHASYWDTFGGSSDDLSDTRTTMGFVKQLLDGLHYEDIRSATRAAGEFDSSVVGVHCYHSIVFIEKGSNVSAIPAGSITDEGMTKLPREHVVPS